MVTVSKLTKTFNSHGNQVTAVDNMNFTVPDGIFAAIVGKSGSGKSTLLSLLGALDLPTSGSIEVDGEDITKLSDRKLIQYRLTRIGFVFQGYNLVPNLTAIENVMLPMEFAGQAAGARRTRATSLLEQVGLVTDKHGRKPSRLSGGEQQRVAIARALANKPKLILADEPTGNLDSATGKLIVDLLHHLAKKEHTTIVAVTHDLEIARQTDLTLTISDGKMTHSQANGHSSAGPAPASVPRTGPQRPPADLVMQRPQLIIIAAAVAVVTGVAGFGLGRATSPKPAATAAASGGNATGRQGFGAGAAGGLRRSRPTLGTVQSLTGNTLIVTDSAGAQHTVTLTDTTTYSSGGAASGTAKTDLTAGTSVAAFGAADASGTITATRIIVNPSVPSGGAPAAGPAAGSSAVN